MKTWIVIVGIALLTSGCAKSKEDKCKDEGKYWDVSAKECKDKAPEGTPAVTADTRESCKTKAGHVWNAESLQCKKVDYFMLIYEKDDISVRRVLVQLKKPDDFFAGAYRYVRRGKCVKVPASSLPYLAVKANTPVLNEACGHSAASEKKCEPGIYQLIVKEDNNQLQLQSVVLDAERTDCEVLEMSSE